MNTLVDRAEEVTSNVRPVSWMPALGSVPERCIVEKTSEWLEALGMPSDCIAKVLGTSGLYLMDLSECFTLTSAPTHPTGEEGLVLVDARVTPVHLTLETKTTNVLLILTGLTIQGFELTRV